MTYEQLQVTKANKVALCRFYNPPLNMLNGRMMAELDQFIQDAESDDDVRVILFTGGVPGIFISHFDVSELLALSDQEMPSQLPPALAMPHHQVHDRLERMPKPVIAAINGNCQGGGCEFALACDIRLMAKGDFAIGLPEVGLGIPPGGGGTQRLPRTIGPARALEMMLLGRAVDADEAERIGLIHQAVPAIDLLSTALTLAARLACGAPIAQGLIKRCVHTGAVLPLNEGLQIEFEAFAATLATEDAREAMAAYLDQRLHEFKGR